MFKLASAFLFFTLSATNSIANTVDEKINSLFNNNPQNKVVALSDGTKLNLPVHYYQIAALVTLGTVDLNKTRELMKETGLYPIPVSENKGFAIIYMVDHTANTIGNYREFVTLVAATPDAKYAGTNWKNKFQSYKKILSAFFPSFGDREARNNKNFFFYVPFISVTTNEALVAGREVWNLPKQLADFNLNYTGTKNSALLRSPNCTMGFQQSENHRPLELPLYMDFNLVGFWNKNYNKIVKAPMLAKGTGYISLFDRKKGDSFFVDEGTECGKWISEARFKPKAWQYVPRSGAVLFDESTDVRHLNEVHNLANNKKESQEFFVQELVRTSDF